MAFKYIDLGNNCYDLIEIGFSTMAEMIEASAFVVDVLARGGRFPKYPNLRREKLRLRKQRSRDVLRELRSADRFGLRFLAPEELDLRRPTPGRFLRAYADWGLLDWWIQEWVLAMIDGRPVEVPVLPDGRIKETMNSAEVRAFMGWSQSLFEKLTPQLPGLQKEAGAFGVEVTVDTVKFLLAINDPCFPFLRKASKPRRNH